MPSELIETMRAIWGKGVSLDRWLRDHTASLDLVYQSGQQLEDLRALDQLAFANDEVRVCGQHRSKSVPLPVGIFRYEHGDHETYVVTRNNFHTLALVVATSFPIQIDCDVVHCRMSPEQYESEKLKAMQRARPDDLARFETDDWMPRWSGESVLRTDGAIYRCSTTHPVYYEGMEDAGVPRDVFSPYQPGVHAFAAHVRDRAAMLRIMSDVRDDHRHVVHARGREAIS